MAAPKPVKAFIVETDDPEETVVQFATTNVAARRHGAEQIGTDFECVSCKRLPWADQYAGTDIPPAAFLANGWRYECATCGDSVDSQTKAPTYHLDLVFCSSACEAAEVAQRKAESEAKSAIVDATLAKFPGASGVQGYVRGEDRIAYFCFPGGRFSATWRLEEDHVAVAPADVAAWNAWRKTETAMEGAV